MKVPDTDGKILHLKQKSCVKNHSTVHKHDQLVGLLRRGSAYLAENVMIS